MYAEYIMPPLRGLQPIPYQMFSTSFEISIIIIYPFFMQEDTEPLVTFKVSNGALTHI